MRKLFTLFTLVCLAAGTLFAVTTLAGESAQSGQPAESECLDCHSNIELLETLAEEEEIPAPPSEGSG